tara:strand:+ start:292 stop:660 length:369 start_codon:yes stop_codon:yes gene_type:complete
MSSITPKQTTFLLDNWEQLVEMKIATHSKINEMVEGYLEKRYNNLHRDYMDKKKQQLEYYHKKFNSDSEESKNKKKERAEYYKKKYQSNPEIREKQKIRMREYRKKQKELIENAKVQQQSHL